MQALLLAAVLLPLASAFVLPEAPKNPENLDVYTIPYNDATARKKILFAAGAAYGSNPQQCLDKAFTGASIRRIITARCDVNPADKCVGYTAVSPQDKAIIDTCSGFTGVDHESQAILVAFRGTNRNAQLLVEAVETVFANNKSWVSGGHVSEYFSDAFFKIWTSGMKDDVISLMSRYPSYQVWVTGHSLGGALASLAATYLRYTSLVSADQLLLVTFGQPRTGNMDFATSVDNLVPNAYRVTHSHDPVPHLPGQGHHGYFHHKSEVYYNKNMGGWEICEKDESEKCSNGNLVDLDFEIRPVFNKTVVYLTGGFRTVSAMINAISCNATQGIGLGRPITAEPDLPKKILKGRVISAVQDSFNPNDIATTALASGTQMDQMGRTSLEKASGNIMHLITDFSDGLTVQKFCEALGHHVEQAALDISEGKIPKAIIAFN